MLPILAEDRLIGTRIEKCVVERLIGRGGYGLTFLAFDEELREHRVLKVSNVWAEDDAGRRRQEKSFIEEGLILSRLKHPQIVTLRGQGERHGHRYMVLDYIQGFSLKSALDIVAARRAELDARWEDLLDPVTAAALVLSSLHPLEYAHRANVHLPDREIFGVAHRDISPGNLILGVKGNEKGKVILIDFGTAKTDLTDTTTVNQNLVGTVPYMSKARLQKAASGDRDPEYQDFWRRYRETQNDIHALGVLFYQLLTGRLPFYGETTPQIIVRVLDPDSYAAIHREMAASFPALAAVLRKCLVYFDFSQPHGAQPYQYPDASAMRLDLEEAFATLSPGRSVQEVLVAFSSRLTEPALFAPPNLRSRPAPVQAESAEFAIPASPGPLPPSLAGTLPPPRRAAFTLLASVAAAFATLAFLIWMGRGGSKVPPETLASLEPLAIPRENPAAPASKNPPGKEMGNKSTRSKTRPTVSPPGAPSLNPAPPTGDPAPSLPSPESSTPVTGAAQAFETALAAGTAGADWGKEDFIQVQNLVREDAPIAYEKVTAWLAKVPDSPDLLLLKCQLILKRNPTSQEARRTLAGLQNVRPTFHHPQVFRENAAYLLWLADAAIYESQKTPASRINLLKSANVYLSEFAPNPVYAGKVEGIRARLPGKSP